ncbi:hypothetical protein KI387_004802, partial [Taxus chinensis]
GGGAAEEESLAKTLLYFYPLAGRLAISAEGVVYIDCNDTGADFIEASAAADIGLADVTTEKRGQCCSSAVCFECRDQYRRPVSAPLSCSGNEAERRACSGIHCKTMQFIDGTSLWHFIKSWAQLCREPSSLTPCNSLPPLHTRSFCNTSTPVNLNLHHFKTRTLHQNSPQQFREKIFHFTSETIVALKKQANKSASKDETISSFQALCAHIWQAITRARGISSTEKTTFKLPVNCRPRLVPPLPRSYFGNAIQMVGATVAAGDLLERGLDHAARVLHRIISAHQDPNIRAELEKPPTIIEIDKYIPKNCVSMGSSPRFPMYDSDFGWGRPVAARSGWTNKFDGKMSAYPGHEGSGSVDIEICLLPKTMSVLESDPNFLFPWFED